MKKTGIILILFISVNSFAQRSVTRELYPAKYKTLKQALRNQSYARKVEVYNYSDSVFPNKELLKLKNVENICLRASMPPIKRLMDNRSIKRLKDIRPNMGDSTYAFSKIRIDTIALKQLTHLKYLTIVGFDFDRCLKDIFVVKNLAGLAINFCSISFIPKEIAQLNNLEILDLRLNDINSLPQEINQLDNLKYLILANNSFTNIPAEILHVKNLKEVNFANIEQRYDDPEGLYSPYIFHLNKIDYIRDIGLFTNLLELQNIKSVIVDMQTIEKKKELMLKIKNKTLIHKVKLFR